MLRARFDVLPDRSVPRLRAARRRRGRRASRSSPARSCSRSVGAPDLAGLARARARRRAAAWWASIIQSAGTLFFNVTTYQAMHTALTAPSTTSWSGGPTGAARSASWSPGRSPTAPRRVAAGCRARRAGWWQPAVNLLGCVFFGISAVAGYVVPSTGSMLDQAAANWNTSLGAACFLACALDTLHTGEASKIPVRRWLRGVEHGARERPQRPGSIW